MLVDDIHLNQVKLQYFQAFLMLSQNWTDSSLEELQESSASVCHSVVGGLLVRLLVGLLEQQIEMPYNIVMYYNSVERDALCLTNCNIVNDSKTNGRQR